MYPEKISQSYLRSLFFFTLNPFHFTYESYIGKLLMRWAVLTSDALIFSPVHYFITVYYSGKPIEEKSSLAWHIALILLNPCIMLIDHGNFQYNFISLGLTVAAVAAILSDRDVVGSILFSLVLNHKQVVKLGLALLRTSAVVWIPHVYSPEAFLEGQLIHSALTEWARPMLRSLITGLRTEIEPRQTWSNDPVSTI